MESDQINFLDIAEKIYTAITGSSAFATEPEEIKKKYYRAAKMVAVDVTNQLTLVITGQANAFQKKIAG